MAVNFNIYRGDTLPVSLALTSTSTAATAFDLTGYSAAVYLRWRDGEQCQSKSLASTSSELTIASTAGTITGTFSSTHTKCLPSAVDYYLTLTTTTPTQQTYFLGKVKVLSCMSSNDVCCE